MYSVHPSRKLIRKQRIDLGGSCFSSFSCTFHCLTKLLFILWHIYMHDLPLAVSKMFSNKTMNNISNLFQFFHLIYKCAKLISDTLEHAWTFIILLNPYYNWLSVWLRCVCVCVCTWKTFIYFQLFCFFLYSVSLAT